MVNKNPPKAGLLLGVTNPFFEGVCKHWPHVVSLERGMMGVPSGIGGIERGTAGRWVDSPLFSSFLSFFFGFFGDVLLTLDFWLGIGIN